MGHAHNQNAPVRPPSTQPLYLVTIGSVFASAALGVLISKSSIGLLWMSFSLGVVVILLGCVAEFRQRRDPTV